MNEYEVEVTMIVTVEAPGYAELDGLLDDCYGVGSGGEGVTVKSMDYKDA